MTMMPTTTYEPLPSYSQTSLARSGTGTYDSVPNNSNNNMMPMYGQTSLNK